MTVDLVVDELRVLEGAEPVIGPAEAIAHARFVAIVTGADVLEVLAEAGYGPVS